MGLFDFLRNSSGSDNGEFDRMSKSIQENSYQKALEIKKTYIQDLEQQAVLQKHQMVMAAAQQNNPYGSYAQQQGIQTVGINSGHGTTVTIPVGQNYTIGTTLLPAPYPTSVVPPPAGVFVDIEMIEADGRPAVIRVDVAFADVIRQISELHRTSVINKPKHLPDPEFDLDEMAAASELLEDLNGCRSEGP